MRRNDIEALIIALLLIAAVLAFWVPILAIPISEATVKGSPEQWLGFAGSLAGAVATLSAAVIALLAAYKTLAPMKMQLSELVRQNEHSVYDKLRERAAALNEERILLYRVTSDSEVLDRQIAKLLASENPMREFEAFALGLDRLSASIGEIHVKRGDVWGNKQTQIHRDKFIDACLRCGSVASQFSLRVRGVGRALESYANKELRAWQASKEDLFEFAEVVHVLIEEETVSTRRAIGMLEQRLFVSA